MAIRPSMRARLNPAQVCIPPPNARCGLGCREMSSASGCAKTAGSRFAAPIQSVTRVPSGNNRPPMSTGSHGAPISQLVGTLVTEELLHRRSDQIRRHNQPLPLVGSRQQRRDTIADQIVVVSCPAFRRKMQFWTNSPALSRSPATSPSIRAVRTSGLSWIGFRRRTAMRPSR